MLAVDVLSRSMTSRVLCILYTQTVDPCSHILLFTSVASGFKVACWETGTSQQDGVYYKHERGEGKMWGRDGREGRG